MLQNPEETEELEETLPLEVAVKQAAKAERPADWFSLPHAQQPVTAPPSIQQKPGLHPHPAKLNARARGVLSLDPLLG